MSLPPSKPPPTTAKEREVSTDSAHCFADDDYEDDFHLGDGGPKAKNTTGGGMNVYSSKHIRMQQNQKATSKK